MSKNTAYPPTPKYPSFRRNSVIKNLATLLIFGLAYSNQAIAQELGLGDIDAAQDTGGTLAPADYMTQRDLGSPFNPSLYPPAMLNQPVPADGPRSYDARSSHSLGRPVIVLPVLPGPANINMRSGFQYPGSYMPRDTPLHRFNGYTVCDPPNLARETTTKTEAGAKAQRLVKTTSTRSLAAPSHQQPCPIYTINGELPQQESHAKTTAVPSTRNAPSRQKGERQ